MKKPEIKRKVFEYIQEHQTSLKSNKLDGFFDDYWDEHTDVTKAISKFLDDCGIVFEDYTDHLPGYFSCAPKRWIHGDTLVVPPRIRKLGHSSFDREKTFKVLDARHVEYVCNWVIDDTDCEVVIFGYHLKFVEPEAFLYAYNLKTIQIPKSLKGSKVSNQITECIKDYCHANTKPQIEVY